MNQLPQYAFELLTDKDLTIGTPVVDVDWFNDGAGTPWVNYSEGARFVAASGDSQLLRKSLPDMPAGVVLDIVVQVKTVNACQINVAYKTANPNPTYYIHRRKLTNATGFTIIRFRFQTYTANPKGIAVSITNTTGPVDVVVSYIRVAVIDGDRRVVVPGGFKSISLELDRMLELNGLTQLVNGVITLFGADLTWLLDRVRVSPSRTVKIGLTITSGPDVLVINPVILDVLNISVVADGGSYKASLVMLPDQEWMNFIAYYSEGLDTSKPFDRIGVPTVQAQGTIEVVSPPTGKQISLTRKFFGYVGQTETITLQPEQTVRIGFGSDIEINDGFKTSIGLTSNPTIETEDGQLLNVVGTVKIIYTKSNAQLKVTAVLTAGAAPTELSSGVVYNINIVQALGTQNSSQYDVTVYNGSGSSQTIKINTGSPNSFLNVSTLVTYALQPQGIQLWQGIKSLLSRILGEYDSIDMPALEDLNKAGINDGFDASWEIRNPPVQFIDNILRQHGNWYIGGTYDWEQIGLTVRGASPSNIFKVPFTDQAPNGGVVATSYSTKAVYDLRLDFDIPNTTLNMFIDIYGFNGIQYELLKTVQFLGTNINTALDLTARYYDSIGLVSRGGGIVSISVFQVLLNTGTYNRQGEYAMNFMFNGISSRESDPAVDSLCINTSMQNGGSIVNKLFGLAMLPVIENNQPLKFRIADFSEAYRSDVSTVDLYLQNFTETIDNDLAFDRVKVGGPYRNDEPYDANASCTESSYASTWASTSVRKDLAFNVCLNTNMIINKELGNDDLYLLNLSERSTAVGGNRYRLDNGLTIVGSVSPMQINWIHSESRIMRRNIPVLFSGKPTYFRLIESIEGNQVFVNYPADGFGLISDATLITGVGSFTPFIIDGETALTLEEFKQVQVDKYKLFNLIVDGLPKYQVYIKNVVYNFATGKMLMKVWIKNYL